MSDYVYEIDSFYRQAFIADNIEDWESRGWRRYKYSDKLVDDLRSAGYNLWREDLIDKYKWEDLPSELRNFIEQTHRAPLGRYELFWGRDEEAVVRGAFMRKYQLEEADRIVPIPIPMGQINWRAWVDTCEVYLPRLNWKEAFKADPRPTGYIGWHVHYGAGVISVYYRVWSPDIETLDFEFDSIKTSTASGDPVVEIDTYGATFYSDER